MRNCNPEVVRRQSSCGSLDGLFEPVTTQVNKLREDMKFRILRLLQDNPAMSQRKIAKEVGCSTGGRHYVLKAEIDSLEQRKEH